MFKDILSKDIYQKILALLILIVILYLMRNMLNLILLTFILSFIFYNIQDFVFKSVGKYLHIKRKFITFFIYILFVGIIVFLLYKYLPIILKQFIEIGNDVQNFDISTYKLNPTIKSIVYGIDIQSYINEGGKYAIAIGKNIGLIGFDFFMSFLLSLFFNLDKDEVIRFFDRFEKSKISFLIKQYKYFGKSFLNSFGKVLQTQLLIALINALLSAIMLGILKFPQILGLSAMIFILGLIPMAGVFISLIPLSIIAFNIGGFIEILYVIIMVTILHTLEGYVLNPKLMSAKVKLPTFITFMLLLISEHFLGIWGLLIGIPLFIFFLDMIGVRV